MSGERSFAVVGMMNSGTNIVERLLCQFGRGVRCADTPPRTWKHTTRREDIETLGEADIVFVCMRHPLLVIHSTLNRKHALSCTSVREPAEIVRKPKHVAGRDPEPSPRIRFDNMVHYFNEAMQFYAELVRRLGEKCVVVEYERLLSDPDECLGVTRGALQGLETPAKKRMGHVGAAAALSKASRKATLLPPDDADFVASNLAPNPFYALSPSSTQIEYVYGAPAHS
eukprot:jgi/Tetstr1/454068/TSEL_040987.t1